MREVVRGRRWGQGGGCRVVTLQWALQPGGMDGGRGRKFILEGGSGWGGREVGLKVWGFHMGRIVTIDSI